LMAGARQAIEDRTFGLFQQDCLARWKQQT